jgi:hypothetical protein
MATGCAREGIAVITAIARNVAHISAAIITLWINGAESAGECVEGNI